MSVYVDFLYKKKTTRTYEEGSKEFSDPVQALRFMYYMANHGGLITGYRADDPDDYEYLKRRFLF